LETEHMKTGKEGAGSGIAGLDDVLAGGFTRGHTYLVEGTPGTGKTTLGLQFLREGARHHEPCLHVTLAETAQELRATAASHGWSLDGIALFELVAAEGLLDAEQQQSLLYSADLELGEATRAILEQVGRLNPARIVFDGLAEICLLAQGALRYRRQLLALKRYFATAGATVLLLDDMSMTEKDLQLRSIVHGVLRLEQLTPAYGAERRRLRVVKYRGTRYRGGFHDFIIDTGGLRVFPRLVAAEHRRPFRGEMMASGIAGLDLLLGGGLERGTSTLVMGPAGSGKSLLALHHAVRAAAQSHKAVLYVFEEEIGLLLERAAGVGIDLDGYVQAGRLLLEQVDATELSPGEFAHRIRGRVEQDGARLVVIDSLNGYQAAMPEEQFLVLHMHELLTYLNRQGVVTVLTMAQHGLLGEMRSPADVTYLSDTLVLLRFFEAAGRVRRAISVVKKRMGAHEDTIREFQLTRQGLQLGAPLEAFQGVLQGVPSYRGQSGPLLGGDNRS
jgi:circadian clock protein KaiC